MTLVKPNVFMALVKGITPSKGEAPLYGMQVVSRGRMIWAKKSSWLRNAPIKAKMRGKKALEILKRRVSVRYIRPYTWHAKRVGLKVTE